jgi:hypothetical protein
MGKFDELLELVQRADFQEIEAARDQVEFSDLGAMAAAYPSLKTWDQKAALINLVQDHLDPRFRPIMLDFLEAPDTRGDDVIPLTKAIALCHLDENFDIFMDYYKDQRLIQIRANEYLQDTPGAILTQEEPINPPSQKISSSLQIFAVTAIIVGLALLALRAINLFSLNDYRKRGILTQARVTHKWEETDSLCIGVTYFDKDLLEGGELYLTEVCDFVSNEVWNSLQVDSQIQVVFLPKDPANNTILAVSLGDENLATINRYPIGGIMLGLGIAALIGSFIFMRIN